MEKGDLPPLKMEQDFINEIKYEIIPTYEKQCKG